MVKTFARWKWTLIGCCFTPPAMLIGFVSTGAGHGDYVWARIVYPLPSIAMALLPEAAVLASLPVSLSQFVLYGLALDVARRRRALALAAFLVAILHCTLVVILFTFIQWPD